MLHISWEINLYLILGCVINFFIFIYNTSKLDLKIYNYKGKKTDIMIHFTLTIRVTSLIKDHLLMMNKLKSL